MLFGDVQSVTRSPQLRVSGGQGPTVEGLAQAAGDSLAPLPQSQDLTYIFLEVNFGCGWVDNAFHSHGANMADVTLGQGQLHQEGKMDSVGKIRSN